MKQDYFFSLYKFLFTKNRIDKDEIILKKFFYNSNYLIFFTILLILVNVTIFLRYIIHVILTNSFEMYFLIHITYLFLFSILVVLFFFYIFGGYIITSKRIIVLKNAKTISLYYSNITDVIKEKDSIQIYVRTKNSFEAKPFVLKTLRHHTEEIYNLIQKNIENKNKE